MIQNCNKGTKVVMKKVIMFISVQILFCLAAFSQSADKVSQLIQSQKATYGQVSYLSAVSLGLAQNDSTETEAIDLLRRAGILSNDIPAQKEINYENTAWILVNTFKANGSLWLKMFPSPRYAFKLLKAQGIISSAADPHQIPTGRDILNMFTDGMSFYQQKNAHNNME